MFYKGYVKTKGKASIEKLKDRTDFADYDEIKNEHEFGGVLADDIILIDIDDAEQAEKMMDIVETMQLNCRVYATERGKHFLFKNDGVSKNYTGAKLACGLKADIKIGSRTSYQVLKLEGEERFIEWDEDASQPLCVLPKWMRPITTKLDFKNLGEGDGRNSLLYGYILTLNNAGFSKDDARETIKIINDFVLSEPLSDDEIDSITRDDAFPKETFYKDKAFLHNNFAEFIKNNNHIKRINGQLHVYHEGVYVGGVREIEQQMVKYIPTLKSAQRVEVLKYLDIICSTVSETAPANMIAFNNGIYDIVNDSLMDFSPDIIVTNKIPWDYDVDAYSELADNTLNKLACNDPEIRALIDECIGYCFFRRNEMSKAFILTGDKSNGKSTFLDIVKNVLGKGNYSALDLQELDERFSIASMAGKLANIGDDISDDFMKGRSVSVFKKIVSGNEVKAEFKGQDTFSFNPYVKLIFSANEVPRIKDKTGAVLRRLVIIPFNARFSKDDPDFDPFITWKLREPEVMKYIVRIGIAGLKRIIIENAFTESTKAKAELDKYEISNNPILTFFSETDESEILNNETKQVYLLYRGFCGLNGFQELTLANFSKEVCKHFGCEVKRKRINGKQVGIYEN